MADKPSVLAYHGMDPEYHTTDLQCLGLIRGSSRLAYQVAGIEMLTFRGIVNPQAKSGCASQTRRKRKMTASPFVCLKSYWIVTHRKRIDQPFITHGSDISCLPPYSLDLVHPHDR